MSTHDPSMHDPCTHMCREHDLWEEQLETWQAEHQRALAHLARIQAALMEHSADIEEYLVQIRSHRRFLLASRDNPMELDGSPALAQAIQEQEAEHERQHRVLRHKIRYEEATHRQTIDTLTQTIARLHQIRSDFRNGEDYTLPKANFNGRDHVAQAGIESFPASDPPSFNPGIA